MVVCDLFEFKSTLSLQNELLGQLKSANGLYSQFLLSQHKGKLHPKILAEDPNLRFWYITAYESRMFLPGLVSEGIPELLFREEKRTRPPPKENLLGNFSGLKEKLSRPVVDTKPYKNQENHIYHRNLSSVAPVFFSAKKSSALEQGGVCFLFPSRFAFQGLHIMP